MAEQAARRRTSYEVDALILAAARSRFAVQGYAGTSTREIAAHAGVHEPMLYRRYGSKAGLFRAAVLVPFNEVISDYLATWEAQRHEPASLEVLVRAFIDPLYALLREHGELALALVQARDVVGEDMVPWPTELGGLLARMVPQLEIEGARRGLRVDASTTNVVVLGMVLGLSLLDPVLSTSSVSTTPEHVNEAMVDLVLHGVSPGDSASVDQRLAEAERRAATAERELALLRAELGSRRTADN